MTLSDGDGGSIVKDITIRINTPPVADDDAYDATEDETLVVNEETGVLDGDTDAEHDPLKAVLDTTTSNGSLSLSGIGSFTYDPDANYCGDDSFTYHVNDGFEDSNIATVSITVNCVHVVPTLTQWGLLLLGSLIGLITFVGYPRTRLTSQKV